MTLPVEVCLMLDLRLIITAWLGVCEELICMVTNTAKYRRRLFDGYLWSRSYFACSAGGATIETLKEYVNSQSPPD